MTFDDVAPSGYDNIPRVAVRAASGVRQANLNADEMWRGLVDQGIRKLSESGVVFTAYDLAALGVPEPNHPSQWGGRLSAARRAGTIEPVGYTTSKRPTTASSAVRTWRGVYPEGVPIGGGE